MRKVRILKPCFGAGFSYSVDDTPEVNNARADDLIQAGYAELYRKAPRPQNTKKPRQAEEATK